MLHSNVWEIRLHQSVSKHHHMGANACRFSVTSPVYWLCCFCWKLEKTHWWRPTKCAILHFLIKYLLCKWRPCDSSMLCVRTSTFCQKRTKVYASINFSFSLRGWLMWPKDILYHCQKNKRRIHGVLSSLSE